MKYDVIKRNENLPNLCDEQFLLQLFSSLHLLMPFFSSLESVTDTNDHNKVAFIIFSYNCTSNCPQLRM